MRSTPSRRGVTLQNRVWAALGVGAALVLGINGWYAWHVLMKAQPQGQPLIPGILLHPPRLGGGVLTKEGVSALQQPQWQRVPPALGPDDGDGKDWVVQRLQEATIHVNATLRQRLPTWEQVQQVIGDRPRIWVGSNYDPNNNNNNHCTSFRTLVPPVRRMLGAAGMFSTGTNLVTTLLKQNCQIPERVAAYGPNATKEAHGMRWQVPWGKHTPAHYRDLHATDKARAIAKDDVLPVVTIRNPYRWMASLCKHPYTARWNHNRRTQCPQLLQPSEQGGGGGGGGDDDENHDKKIDEQWNTVSVKYGAGTETYPSLAHLYNEWYQEYLQNTSYPWIMIRMEDLIFYTKETVATVCECAGGRIRTDRPFTYTIASAKADSQGHDTSVGYVEAWIRYSQPLAPRGGFSESDYQVARAVLDPTLLQRFGYTHPEPP